MTSIVPFAGLAVVACRAVIARKVGFWPILLKKSVKAVNHIFLASWVKFATKCAEDRMLRRRRDVCRSKWDYEADNSRS
jgi:hypothetical protein